MVLPKPTSNSDWTVGNPDFANVTIEPGVAKKEAGWAPNEKPPSEFFNWLFFITDQWVKYLESVTDAQAIAFDAIIGDTGTNPAATHDTLQDAVDDVSLGANVSVLVTEGQTIDTTIDLSKPGWRIQCAPGIVFTKGAATIAISMNADALEWLNGRFVGFTVGGDIGLNFTAAGTYGKVIGSRFAPSTDTEVNDSAVAAGRIPVVSQTISET